MTLARRDKFTAGIVGTEGVRYLGTNHEFKNHATLFLKGTVSPDLIGLKAVWFGRP